MSDYTNYNGHSPMLITQTTQPPPLPLTDSALDARGEPKVPKVVVELPRYCVVIRRMSAGVARDYVYFRHPGHPHRRLPHWTAPDFATAYQQALAGASEPVRAGQPSPVAGSLGETVRRWTASAEFKTGLSARTQRDYLAHIGVFADPDLWRDTPVRGIDQPAVLDVRDVFAEDDAPKTTNKRIAVLSAFFTWAVARGLTDTNPCQGIRQLRGGQSFKPWPRPDLERFLLEARMDVARVVFVGATTLLRFADCLRLTTAHYDASSNSLAVRIGKNNEPVRIACPDLLARIIERRIAEAGVGDRTPLLVTNTGRPWTYYGLQKQLRSERARLGLAHLHFHGLRATGGQALIDTGHDGLTAQRALAHRDQRSTEIYIRGADQLRRSKLAAPVLESATGAGVFISRFEGE